MTSPGIEDRIRAVLRTLAREKRLITYSDLAETVPGAPSHRSRELYELLGDISEESYREHEIFLSALVIRDDWCFPGEGFFTKLVFPAKGVESVPDWKRCWEAERDRVYEFYAHRDRSSVPV